MNIRGVKLNAVQTVALSFAVMILLGALLLVLPIAAKTGQALPFLDALFTAASASCVTGLALYDTGTQFTVFGQAIILALIQIGGLSFVTVSAVVFLLLGRRIGLRRRTVLVDSVGALQMGGVVRLTRRAVKVALVCEGIGAVLLAFWFVPRYGVVQGLWMAVFHAVSAFCNAGFDLLGTGNSLADTAGAPFLLIVLMILIVCGGLGFLVWDDVLTHGHHFCRWRLHSKLVLVSTLSLFLLGTVAFYLLESSATGAFTSRKWLTAAFQSVTCRTAGFAAMDQRVLSDAGTLLTLLLMLIGVGSGSTGGGVKVNTVAVLILCAVSGVRRRRDVNLFHRRLDHENIQKAYFSVTLYLLACLAGCMLLCLQGLSLTDALFEAVSAIGTVGLSRGVTATLSAGAKWTVMLLMFAGRVGSMSVAMAVTRNHPRPKLRNVSEKILIG